MKAKRDRADSGGKGVKEEEWGGGKGKTRRKKWWRKREA